MSAYIHPPQEPIAIIGSGCRFPGDASSPSRLWDLLVRPRDVSKRVPETRFNPDGFYHPDGEHHGASNVTKSYFIEEDPRLFDSVFFNISPREAEAIDPQQRLLLETVYEAMESSGLTLKQLQGSLTSAYVGIMTNDYTDTHARDTEFFSQYQATGTSRALSSNRLSYFFDWKGPSMTVDTACSSSLTAIHLALQSLRSGESQIACAAGANLLLGPDLFIGATSLHMISPSGKSQMWDAGADGYARGEGIAAVFLKTLSQALRDGDRIDALIRETGVNSDGRTKGITLPSPEAQARLIRDTYARAGLDLMNRLHRPQYFEAHGTGTQAGDPREASAIRSAFFPVEEPGEKLLVGSIKTVVGHTEGCAGIAGVLKAMLAMKNRTIPPNQHLKVLNPKVELSYANLLVPQEATAWPAVAEGHPLRASVNSFGFGGTNSHAILETYVPEIHDKGPWGYRITDDSSVGNPDKALSSHEVDVIINKGHDFTPVPLVLSANSDKALLQMASNYAEILRSSLSSSSSGDSTNLLQTAWTLHNHRTLLPHRIVFSGTSRLEILADMQKKITLAQDTPGKDFGRRISNNTNNTDEGNGNKKKHTSYPRILGVFTGQGAQWPQMGRDLILQSAEFRRDIRALEESLRTLPDPPSWSLEEELLAGPKTSRLSEAALSQPLCTAVQVALYNLLSRSGIRFHTVVGHSSGEIAAAYAAGRISARDAVRIAYYRGVHARLAGGGSGQKGSMIAVGFGIDEAKMFCESQELKRGRLMVAASNSPGGVTLSGDADAVDEAKGIFDQRGLFNRVLQVDTAYHSHHMAPCADVYVESLLACGIKVLTPTSPPEYGDDSSITARWVSSVYGTSKVPGEKELRATYWRDNMVQTVLFSQAIDEALESVSLQVGDGGEDAFDFAIEVGPHPALRGPALQTIKARLGHEVPYAGVLDRKNNDVTAVSDMMGAIWTSLGPEVVNLGGYASSLFTSPLSQEGQEGISGPARFVPPKPLADLPLYPWQHETIVWRESRLSRQYRLRSDPPHELLGVRTADDTPHEPRWRNLLKLKEVPWLKDHRIQGQVVVPGAAYCVMALEAAKVLARERQRQTNNKRQHVVAMVELRDLVIERPISLNEASEATETLFSLRDTTDATENLSTGGVQKGSSADHHPNEQVITAQFVLSAGAVEDGAMRRVCHGEVRIHLRSEEADSTSSRLGSAPLGKQSYTPRPNLRPMSIDKFYSSLNGAGLEYSGAFRGLVFAERELDTASGVIAARQDGDIHVDVDGLPVHPSWLDVSFQTLFAALSSPGDGGMWTAFVPSYIRKIRFASPDAARADEGDNLPPSYSPNTYHVDAYLTDIRRPTPTSRLETITGDVSVFSGTTGAMEIQIEDVTMTALLPSSAADDRPMYMRTLWRPDVVSSGVEMMSQGYTIVDAEDGELARACDVVLGDYLSRLERTLNTTGSRGQVRSQHKALAELVVRTRESMKAGLGYDVAQDVVARLKNKFADSIDMQLLAAVGDMLLRQSLLGFPPQVTSDSLAARSSASSLQKIWQKVLHRAVRGNHNNHRHHEEQVLNTVAQVAHKHPRMRILQVGVHANVDPAVVVKGLGGAFASYTVLLVDGESEDSIKELQAQGLKDPRIDVREMPADETDGLLDSEAAPSDMVLYGFHHHHRHSGATLSLSFEKCRSLLRPGGYLIFGDLGYGHAQHIFAEHGLDILFQPGTRPDEDTATHTSAKIQRLHSPVQLNQILRQNGFSGIDAMIPSNMHRQSSAASAYTSLVLSQATDPVIDILRAPLDAANHGTSDRTQHPEQRLDAILGGIRVAIIGGQSLETARLADKLRSVLLRGLNASLDVFLMIDTLASPDLTGKLADHDINAVISLADLEASPVLENLDETALRNLQLIANQVKTVLWVTRVATSSNDTGPYRAASAGLWRTITSENAQLAFQLLEFDHISSSSTGGHTAAATIVDERLVAESFIRLALSASMPELRDGSYLWTRESEIKVVVGGGGGHGKKVLVPRVVPDVERNARHNAKRRVVTKVDDTATPQMREETPLVVKISPLLPQGAGGEGITELKVAYSSAKPVIIFKQDNQCLNVVVGTDVRAASNTWAAALVSLNDVTGNTDSQVSSPGIVHSISIPTQLHADHETSQKPPMQLFTSAMVSKLRAMAIVATLPARKTSVVLGATKPLIHAVRDRLRQQASGTEREKNMKKSVVFLTTDPSLGQLFEEQTDSNEEITAHEDGTSCRIAVVHPEASTRLVRTQLPWETDAVYDLSCAAETPLDYSLSQGVKWWCRHVLVSNDNNNDKGWSGADASSLVKALETAVRYAADVVQDHKTGLQSDKKNTMTMISREDYVSSPSNSTTVIPWSDAIVDWTERPHQQEAEHEKNKSSDLIIPVSPISAEGLFSPDKTYLLFGLTGQIGRSIAQWIIHNGGRHIVMASRRGPTAATHQQLSYWQADLRRTFNAVIRIEAGIDITDRSRLETFRDTVLSKMPPVGGVANGAMVLADGLFGNMTLNGMQRVLGPKVLGSKNLDEVFGGSTSGDDDDDKEELDFFIMFSSLSAVVGMPSQANYAAANMYMVGLAAQRRRRGKVASVVDLGMISGLGYISRSDSDEANGAAAVIEKALTRQNYMPVGERDLHEILTEAIVAGKKGNPHEGEIITGLAPYHVRGSSSREEGKREAPPVWVHDARFSHLVLDSGEIRNGDASTGGGSPNDKKTLKTEIARAAAVEEVVGILQRYFVAYLVATLKLSESQIGINVPIIDFGIDSLVAVEIRSWFSLETGQDVPVLKILGGATIHQLCTAAAENIPLSNNTKEAVPAPRITIVKPNSGLTTGGLTVTPTMPKATVSERPPRSRAQSTASTASQHGTGTDTPLSSDQSDQDEDLDKEKDSASPKSTSDLTVVRSGPLSFGQARFYLPSLYLEDKSPFNCTTSYHITGSFDVPRLVQALHAVVQRHEILRTVFTTDSVTGQGLQSVLEKSLTFEPRILAIPVGTSSEEQDKMIETEFREMHKHVFDLEQGDTLRATILTHGDDDKKKTDSSKKHTIIFGYHHIVMDGVSWQNFLQDMAECYAHENKLETAKAAPPHTGARQYLDFTLKQAADLTSPTDRPKVAPVFRERLEYWKSEFPSGLSAPMPLLPFASTRARKLLTEYKTRVVVTHVDAQVVRRIRNVARELRVTAFHFWLAAFQVVLARFLVQLDEDGDDYAEDEERRRDKVSQMCIGIVDANRSDGAFARTIGYLLEILPVKFSVDMAQSFSSMLQGVRSKTYGALARSGVPFEEIVRACRGVSADSKNTSSNDSNSHDPAATPFFQVVFNYRMGATKAPSLLPSSGSDGGAQMTLLDYADATTPFDMSVSLDEKDDGSAMVTFAMLEYLYDQAAADLLVGTYKHVLDVLSRDPSVVVGGVPLFSSAMVEDAIIAGTGRKLADTDENGGTRDAEETVSRRIRRWVERDPDAVAVTESTTAVTRTYREVSRRADVIAAALRRTSSGDEKSSSNNNNNNNNKIGPGSLVCVLTEPGADTVSCILAVLRLGAAYVPLDIRNADERLAGILDESGARIVVFQTATKDRAMKLARHGERGGRQGVVRYLNMSILDHETQLPSSQQDVSRPDDTAFVLYTSGSTGKPKGIALTNANMAVQNASATNSLGIGREVVLQQSGLGFDASLCQIFMALCNGGRLVVGSNRSQDPSELAELLLREGVTFTICMVSEMLAMLRHGRDHLSRCKDWKLALCGGEAFPASLAEEFAALKLPGLQVVNAYGPTEGSIMATIERVAYRDVAIEGESGRILIGETIPEYGVYIVDRAGNPLPRGCTGQIALAGPGVARGYLNNAKLTSDKFRPDSISSMIETGRPSHPAGGWDRIYLTGDKGRLVEGNRFLHLGRIDGDSQVKLRGIRIELQDIRHSIIQAARGRLVDAAVVLRGGHDGVKTRDSGMSQYLAAFVVFTDDNNSYNDGGGGGGGGIAVVRNKSKYLRNLLRDLPLPAYMRPAVAVPLASLPVTDRGKLDTRRLAEMPLDDSGDGGNRHSAISFSSSSSPPPPPLSPANSSARAETHFQDDQYHDCKEGEDQTENSDEEEEEEEEEEEQEGPLTETEAQLKRVWQQVLAEAGVNIHNAFTRIRKTSDFFSVGGNSLLLMQVRVQIRKVFPGVDVPLIQLFQSSSLETLAAKIESMMITSSAPSASSTSSTSSSSTAAEKNESRVNGNTRTHEGDSVATAAERGKYRTIDWDEETKVDDDIIAMLRMALQTQKLDMSPSSSDPSSAKANPINVLLTGATGFLGGALLERLEADPRVGRVHCVAVRNIINNNKDDDDNNNNKSRLPSSPKIITHNGDLSMPRLGMTAAEAAATMADVDVIVHNGASVSHLKSYHSLKGANLGSTRGLVRLAAAATSSHSHEKDGKGREGRIFGTRKKMIPIHYVSTGGIARLSGLKRQPESSLSAHPPPTDGTDGYVATKWASERFLERLAAITAGRRDDGGDGPGGVNITIHRPSSITTNDTSRAQHDDDGDDEGSPYHHHHHQVPASDITHTTLRFARILRAVPDFSLASGAFDFVDISTIVNNIVGDVFASVVDEQADTTTASAGGGGVVTSNLSSSRVTYRHQSGDVVVPVHELRDFLSAAGDRGESSEEDDDDYYRVLGMQDWVKAAVEAGMDPLVGSFLAATDGRIDMPLLVKGDGNA